MSKFIVKLYAPDVRFSLKIITKTAVLPTLICRAPAGLTMKEMGAAFGSVARPVQIFVPSRVIDSSCCVSTGTSCQLEMKDAKRMKFAELPLVISTDSRLLEIDMF
ncbi:MAG: hypothetical protein CVU44_05315 [Chloroflexi bacterium HGW-Chloroflexi-6]|nr:MAG: hypothetical protein CVU44_05315 [Chloroflexi bacterium HGW-Chloroflexi-6]